VLNRGYAIITRSQDGKVVKNTSQVKKNDSIHIRLSRGELDARITHTNPGEPL
jgi:exodeoxyribonuclease VII large subunit